MIFVRPFVFPRLLCSRKSRFLYSSHRNIFAVYRANVFFIMMRFWCKKENAITDEVVIQLYLPPKKNFYGRRRSASWLVPTTSFPIPSFELHIPSRSRPLFPIQHAAGDRPSCVDSQTLNKENYLERSRGVSFRIHSDEYDRIYS